MLMRLNKAETAVHACHYPGDMAVGMRKLLARHWVGVRKCRLLYYLNNLVLITKSKPGLSRRSQSWLPTKAEKRALQLDFIFAVRLWPCHWWFISLLFAPDWPLAWFWDGPCRSRLFLRAWKVPRMTWAVWESGQLTFWSLFFFPQRSALMKTRQ